MSWIAKIVFYLRMLLKRRKVENEMSEEMKIHLEMETEAKIAAGMSPGEAQHAAQREFGNVASIQERTRDEHGWVWLEQWGKDASFALRSLIKARSFSLTVLGTLVVGIGVATVVLELTAGIVVFAQPYPKPEQLFYLGFKDKQNPVNPYRFGLHLAAYQEQVNAFSEYAVVSRDTGNVVVDDEPVIASLLSVSVDCFHTLGIRPVLGREFLPEEFRAGTDNVVVVSDLFWRQTLNASTDVLGRKINIDQQVCTVIGVLAPSQPFPIYFEGDVYRPLMQKSDPANPFAPVLFMIGRLSPGVSPEQARAVLAAVKLPELVPWAAAILAEMEPVLINPIDLARPDIHRVMFAAGALLYAVACVNAVNLMLVRQLGRRRELSIRFALGGTRWQIVRLLILEIVGLSLVASLIVAFVARSFFPSLLALITSNEAIHYRSFWDWRTLGCIGGLSLLASAVVVFVPAWGLFKADLNRVIQEGGTALGTSRRVNRLRSGLIIFQTALAVVLLAGTGLMVRSFEKLRHADLGFDPVGKVKVEIAFPRGYNLAPEARLQLFERLRDKLAKLPGVREVSCGQDALLVGSFSDTARLLMPDGTYRMVAGTLVAENFLKTAGLVLKKGRWLSGRHGEFEAVINEALANARFGNEDPIGKTFRLRDSGDYGFPVVGVVGDVKETVRSAPGMRFYVPSWSFPQNISSLLLKLDQDPGKEFAGVVRRAIYEADPKLIANTVNSLNQWVSNSMWAERYAYMILQGLSLIALGLAAIGLFSVIAFTVDGRRQEFGVRLALGATPENLHRLVMKRGVTTAAIGIAVGVAGALGLTRFMQSLLFETTPNDPMVYGVVAAVMLFAAVLACWLPARRAMKVDPAISLRAE
jgi:putative ABC transport system permease protein